MNSKNADSQSKNSDSIKRQNISVLSSVFPGVTWHVFCVAGVCVGRICLHHQPDSSPCFRAASYAAFQQEAVHRWVTCDVCMFVWASEVHTSPPTQSRHVVLVLPYNEAWTCFLPHAYWFGHRDACAAVVAKCSKAHVSFCIDSSI